MSNNHVKRHTTALAPVDHDMPVGMNRFQMEALRRRATQWLNWRSGLIPEPLWHYPAIRRNYDTQTH